jgi:hypothetical protein
MGRDRARPAVGDVTVSIGTLALEGVTVRDPESFGTAVGAALAGLVRDRGLAGVGQWPATAMPAGAGDGALALAVAEAVWAQVHGPDGVGTR